jgi:plastocyanin
VTISVGQSVTFVNNSGSSHDMESDPHPAHTDCPVMEAVGLITNGQTKLTNAFTTARTCGFHDHSQPDNNSLKGSIIIR